MKLLISHHRLGSLMAVALVGMLLQACPSTGIYRTAQTLEPGTADMALSFSTTAYKQADKVITNSDGSTTVDEGLQLILPNLVPEVSFHLGVQDNLEIGGRVSITSGLLEADLKYRFYGSSGDVLQLAVQPAVGYRAFILASGYHFTLPFVATYQFNDMLSLTVAPYGSYLNVSPTDVDVDIGITGNFLTGGAMLGVQFRGENFHIMPSLDISTSFVDLSETATDVGGSTSSVRDEQITYVIFGLSFGYVSGKELQKLDDMDQKLDRIEEKLDRQTPPAPDAAPLTEEAPQEVPPPAETAPTPETPTPEAWQRHI